jgi:hypothetical protein
LYIVYIDDLDNIQLLHSLHISGLRCAVPVLRNEDLSRGSEPKIMLHATGPMAMEF